MKFSENDVVKIICEKKDFKGKIGTVISVFENPNEAYEVEIIDDNSVIHQSTFLPNELELYDNEF